MDSPFMNTMAERLCARGISVLRFEFPHMAERRTSGQRKPPNRMPVLEAAFRERVDAAPGITPLFIGGKSMGGRVATMIADACSIAGVVALGYPFHPPKQPAKLRVEHLTTLKTPCLIVQGTRDALGSQSEVGAYTLSKRITLHWLEDGDHSFEPRRASGRSSEQNMDEAAAAVDAFVTRLITRAT